MPRKRTAVALAAAAMMVFGAGLYAGVRWAAWRPGAATEIGAPFVLASTKGGAVDQRSLTGKPYAVFFGYTHCPEVCPATLFEISDAMARLGGLAAEFRVFFITVDPERDSIESMRAYLASFDPRIEGLVPTPDQLQELASGFRAFYAKVPSGGGDYSMDHTASVYLFGADGRLSDIIAFGESAAVRREKIARLLSSQ